MTEEQTQQDAPWGHWAAGQFRLQQCATCQHFQHPPGRLCQSCHGADMLWSVASPHGRVVSWSVVHRAPLPTFAELTPYTITLIELDDGPLMEMWQRDVDSEPEIGEHVRVEFAEIAGRRLPVSVSAQD